ncbi:hypothetical protein GCM10017786_65620 [Amycolatopsis deserti]|uniref:Secreted protein n=1 Tax=Amycolatopsis deserti TaxID=185696 RepID=A0ABQ3JCX1_9PSEU|nr:hypothetical protein GCM10017786_65620 [Amycolatopsis deserti]
MGPLRRYRRAVTVRLPVVSGILIVAECVTWVTGVTGTGPAATESVSAGNRPTRGKWGEV